MGGHMCAKCMGVKKLVVGVLLLLNGFVWPMWHGIDGWFNWVAVLFVVGGLVHLLVPNKCKSCNMEKKK
jgi:protein-S-isoprenylcysteine O-methyltransferase Ste14